MPNVEIHGLSESEAKGLRRKIFRLFSDKEYVGEMVVTIHLTDCEDKLGYSQPFIRLANSCQKSTQEIVEKLKSLSMDIEHLKLEEFFPKQ